MGKMAEKKLGALNVGAAAGGPKRNMSALYTEFKK